MTKAVMTKAVMTKAVTRDAPARSNKLGFLPLELLSVILEHAAQPPPPPPIPGSNDTKQVRCALVAVNTLLAMSQASHALRSDAQAFWDKHRHEFENVMIVPHFIRQHYCAKHSATTMKKSVASIESVKRTLQEAEELIGIWEESITGHKHHPIQAHYCKSGYCATDLYSAYHCRYFCLRAHSCPVVQSAICNANFKRFAEARDSAWPLRQTNFYWGPR